MAWKNIAQLVDGAVQATMERIRADIPARIERGQRPSGGPQQPNTPATARSKQKRLGHATPLLGKDRILSDAARWRLQKRSLAHFELSPPDERARVLPHLSAKGYEVGLPAEAVVWLREELQRRGLGR